MKDSMRVAAQEINNLILSSQEGKTLLWEVLRRLTQILKAKAGFLIFSSNLPSVSFSNFKEINQRSLIKLEENLKTILWETTTLKENENFTHKRILTLLKRELTLEYWEILPLFAQDQVGCLICGGSQNLELKKKTQDSLQIPLSLAFKTAWLQLEFEKSKRYKFLRQKVTEVIHSSQDLETILHHSIEQTTQALQVTRGLVLMLRYAEPIFGNRQEIESPDIKVQPLTQWAQTPEKETQLNSFSLSRSPLFLKAWQQAPTAISVTQQDLEKEPNFLKKSNFSSGLVMPLMGTHSSRWESQMVLGFLFLQNEGVRQWQEEEQELVSWVTLEVSTAIIHNKTLQRVQSLVDERTAQLQRSLDVQAKLYETSRHQVEQLQELNQLKDEFLATISHELNTPLATMKMAIEMLHREELPTEKRQKYLSILEKEWKKEYHLIKDLLTLQKIEDKKSSSVKIEVVNLTQVLMELKEEFTHKWREKDLNLVLTFNQIENKESITLQSNGENLRRIFWELLTNAGKYSTANTTVNVVVSFPSINWVRISVTNVGYGLAHTEKKYIFDRFRRGKGATQKAIPGTGLGLALVKSLVQHLHGKIDLDSEYNPDGVGETTFHVTLPRSLHDVVSNNAE